jgi:hypothetical protein
VAGILATRSTGNPAAYAWAYSRGEAWFPANCIPVLGDSECQVEGVASTGQDDYVGIDSKTGAYVCNSDVLTGEIPLNYQGASTDLLSGCVAGLIYAAAMSFGFSYSAHSTADPPGTSVSDFDQQLISQLQSSVSQHGFAVTNAYQVACVLPAVWVAGNQFPCDLYTKSGAQIGQLIITIKPNSDGQWNGELTWYQNV